MIEVHTWQVITFFITIALTLIGMFIGAGKMLMSQFSERLLTQLSALEQRLVAATEMAEKAQKEQQELKIHIAENYQKREDAIRTDTANAARYDAISEKIDKYFIKSNHQ